MDKTRLEKCHTHEQIWTIWRSLNMLEQVGKSLNKFGQVQTSLDEFKQMTILTEAATTTTITKVKYRRLRAALKRFKSLQRDTISLFKSRDSRVTRHQSYVEVWKKSTTFANTAISKLTGFNFQMTRSSSKFDGLQLCISLIYRDLLLLYGKIQPWQKRYTRL